jgi:hypothetical protein
MISVLEFLPPFAVYALGVCSGVMLCIVVILATMLPSSKG